MVGGLSKHHSTTITESGIAGDLYRTFHVWFGPLNGGLALGTIALMVAISALNGLSVAGMAIGATIALQSFSDESDGA